jgi:hypothetical protein
MTVVEAESTSCVEVDPRDPARASARGQHTYRLVRANRVTESCASVAVQATATHFHLTIDLDVRVNDVSHFARRWVESVRRVLL